MRDSNPGVNNSKSSFSFDASSLTDQRSFSFSTGLRGVLKDSARCRNEDPRSIKSVAFRSPIQVLSNTVNTVYSGIKAPLPNFEREIVDLRYVRHISPRFISVNWMNFRGVNSIFNSQGLKSESSISSGSEISSKRKSTATSSNSSSNEWIVIMPKFWFRKNGLRFMFIVQAPSSNFWPSKIQKGGFIRRNIRYSKLVPKFLPNRKTVGRIYCKKPRFWLFYENKGRSGIKAASIFVNQHAVKNGFQIRTMKKFEMSTRNFCRFNLGI